ncbi:helix-turn-helix transcriptional regulator [Paenibacillus woosongensis]|uniref:Helix-turn-helix transcriptional regulator n=1 Tax=Paenibacillus woosongensis TaxID=307580 RepID=A0AA95IAU6_9BACL|nr:helix-turn-helix transcriptional regulator [Paenibacillus woosongensis]WHX48558.1 helix-turn-helix transcriptional regulator [Paenibacillus woosongensis]
MNQTEFSHLIGVSQGTLSELEQNKYNPSLETILAIIKVFNVNAMWLLFGYTANENSLNPKVGELNKVESFLLIKFRKLPVCDQQEVSDIIDLKITENIHK